MTNRKVYSYFPGKRLGSLVLIEFIEGQSSWKAKCDCGNELEVSSRHLYRRKSCGCLSLKSRYRKNFTDKESNLRKVILGEYIPKAEKRSLSWELELDYAMDLIQQNCYYCGSKPLRTVKQLKGVEQSQINGIDRKDNNLGYTIENSFPCCKICNRAKNNMSAENFENWIDNLIKYRNNNEICNN